MFRKRHFLVAATTIGVVACTSYPPTNAGPPAYGIAQLNAATKAPFGSYLVDGAGRAVYLLEGQRHNAGMDRCMGECLRVWPPLHTSGPPTAGPGVDPAQLGSMQMHGAAHVTYAGWPLYYYHRDRMPGDTTGQAIQDRWGRWYLLSPSGEPIRPSGGY
jgi:predicted lipoprotein with Yx(FWY)xxD motif